MGRRSPLFAATATASITWGTTCSGVTKLMLWQPWSWSSSIVCAISSAVCSAPERTCEISQFWQKTQRRLQRPKKIVPEPRHPRRQSSSPKCGKALDTIACRPVWQVPVLPRSRLQPQSRGQALQLSSSRSPASTRAANPPSRCRRRYAGSNSPSRNRSSPRSAACALIPSDGRAPARGEQAALAGGGSVPLGPLPIGDAKAGDASELPGVRGDEHEVVGPGRGRDEQVIRPDGSAGSLEVES